MKYLDETITLSTSTVSISDNGLYQYRIEEEQSGVWTPIFYGNKYCTTSDTVISIDCTDIIANRRWDGDIDKKSTSISSNDKAVNLIRKYRIAINISNTWTNGTDEVVYLMYRYPNKKSSMECEAFDYSATGSTGVVRNLLQGETTSTGAALIPRIPYNTSTNFCLPVALEIGSSVVSVRYALEGDLTYSSAKYVHNLSKPVSLFKFSMYDIFNSATYSKLNDYAIFKVFYKLAANVDLCPEKYYLLWQDRAGSFQCQPFKKIDTFSESFEQSTYTTHKNEKRLYNVKSQPKWKINSAWIDETLYPYYESIFVSPYLQLYDSEEDNVYRVLVTDSDYTEKTFKNQSRKLFNLTLNLELDKKQNIIY